MILLLVLPMSSPYLLILWLCSGVGCWSRIKGGGSIVLNNWPSFSILIWSLEGLEGGGSVRRLFFLLKILQNHGKSFFAAKTLTWKTSSIRMTIGDGKLRKRTSTTSGLIFSFDSQRRWRIFWRRLFWWKKYTFKFYQKIRENKWKIIFKNDFFFLND